MRLNVDLFLFLFLGLHSQSWSYGQSRAFWEIHHLCNSVSSYSLSWNVCSCILNFLFSYINWCFLFLRYDVELFQRIETLIGKKLPAFPTHEEEVMMLVERVSEAQRFARLVRESRPSNQPLASYWSIDRSQYEDVLRDSRTCWSREPTLQSFSSVSHWPHGSLFKEGKNVRKDLYVINWNALSVSPFQFLRLQKQLRLQPKNRTVLLLCLFDSCTEKKQ